MCTYKDLRIYILVLATAFFQFGCRVDNTVESATDGTTVNTSEQLRLNSNQNIINMTEGNNTVLLVVSDKPAAQDVNINWEITGAGGSSDFSSVSGTTSLSKGSSSFSITINTINDTSFETTKNYTLSVWSDDKLVKNNLDIQLVLQDDDPQYSVTFLAGTNSVSEAAGSLNVPVTFSNAYSSDVTINYSVGGTATENNDFSITNSGSIVMTSGNTSVDIPIFITDDALIEGSETIVLAITSASSADIVMGTHTAISITIVDNDIAVKPNAAYLLPGEALALTASGGDGNFTYSMVGTPVSTVNASGVITAAAAVEAFTLRITDGNGNFKDFNYEVIDPKANSNLGLWLKASEMGLSDGDPVTSWADLTSYGHNFSQGTSSNKPQYLANILNSKPVVRFDGTDDFLDSSYLPPTGTSARSVTFVITNLHRKNNSTLFIWGTDNFFGGMYGFNSYAPHTKSRYSGTFLMDQHLNQLHLSSPYVPETTKSYIITMLYTGSVAKMYVNGKLISSDTISLSTGSEFNIKIGKKRISTTDYNFKGDLAEFLLHESSLADAEREKIECYLSRTYNIALISNVNCGVEELKLNYRGSISTRINDTKTITAYGGVPPYYYSMISGTGSIDSSTGLFTAPAVSETSKIRVTDNIGQTVELDIDIVDVPIPMSWLNLAKGATEYTDGEAVTFIRDISGNENHYHQLYTSTAPIYRASALNTQPVLEFNGSKFISAAYKAPTGASSRTFVVVIKNSVSGNILTYGTLSVCSSRFALLASTVYKAADSCSSYSSTATVDTSARILTATYNGTTFKLYENGTQVYSGSISFSTRTDYGIKIGADEDGTDFFFTGDIAELLVYDSVLSGADQTSVESYLSSKFGI
ncbi:MAG: hypothetical protein KDD40_02505 [Bdellovibrionales bacterium]|nr:hypothetical protein [Bdellovibrionales bacterium]